MPAFSYWECVDGSWGDDDDKELSGEEWFDRAGDQLIAFLETVSGTGAARGGRQDAASSPLRLALAERKGNESAALLDGQSMGWDETPQLFFGRPV
jgi:hypothetical protein